MQNPGHKRQWNTSGPRRSRAEFIWEIPVTVADLQANKELFKGQASADELDLLTLKQIPLVKGKNRVRITRAK